MIDALAHLDDPRWLGARDDVMRRAVAAGVTDIISGHGPEVAIPAYDIRVWRAVGLHPKDVTAAWPAAVEAVARASRIADVVAVGEIGLDDRDGMPPLDLQEAACVAQLRLARAHGLPAIVHCVGRLGLLLELLTQHGPHAPGFVLHAFAGPAEMVGQMAALGASFSFGGLVTRPTAKKCHKAAAVVPEDRLLIESDAPDMPVHGWDGLSSPAMLPRVLAALGALRQATPDALARVTAANARRLYKLARPSKTEAR